ncbi:F-box and associated interaction domains-containing protein isoform 3 [Hibiscus syriacus]|uniref:F-box and associated interaction domains-containing protein isoform 3 n=1 Tax=Hibiscus syriacus TaxID=106335 RepID=A0A6A2XX74_HIBSY|nr:F-box and associated interaction domains-containing protein isoform 3 [Hibiscus syriacus]
MADWIEQVELYSLKSDSWKEISVPGVYAFVSILFNNYINVFYYWQASGDYKLILSFDMVNEKFSTLPLPEFGGTLAQCYLELLDFNGLLGAILYPCEGTDKSFDLWVMNGSWTKQFSVESVPGVERPLGFWKNGEMFLESSDHELVLFDPSTREIKNLGIHADRETMRIVAYVESLVPINGRQEHEESIVRRPAGGASN